MVLLSSELERLALLAEECGEVIQVVGKILRHGYEERSPVPHPLGNETNRELLTKEIGDLLLVIDQFFEVLDIYDLEVEERKATKIKKINQYLHHNKFTHYSRLGAYVDGGVKE